jgi:hypothetical protein
VADVALLVIHHLPDDPPTGEMGREVVIGWKDGSRAAFAARMALALALKKQAAWWSELPTLPADPSERLTADDVRDARHAVTEWGRSPDRTAGEALAAGAIVRRLYLAVSAQRFARAALPGEEGTK